MHRSETWRSLSIGHDGVLVDASDDHFMNRLGTCPGAVSWQLSATDHHRLRVDTREPLDHRLRTGKRR